MDTTYEQKNGQHILRIEAGDRANEEELNNFRKGTGDIIGRLYKEPHDKYSTLTLVRRV